jgi:uncharacterized RDD family membrane protein YckC
VLHLSLTVGSLPIIRWAFAERAILPMLALDVVPMLGLLFLLARFGTTPGYFVTRCRVIDAKDGFPGWSRSLIRYSPAIIGFVVSNLRLYAVFRTGSAPLALDSLDDLVFIVKEYGEHYSSIDAVLMAFSLIDTTVIFFNRRRRAIHDFMAGTYVVTDASWKSEHRASSRLRVDANVR